MLVQIRIIKSFEFILSSELGSEGLIEDPAPGKNKVQVWKDGYLVKDVRGVRAHATSRLDGRGYDITKRRPCLLVILRSILTDFFGRSGYIPCPQGTKSIYK